MEKIVSLSSYEHRRKSSYTNRFKESSTPRYKNYPMTEEMKQEAIEIMTEFKEVFGDLNTYFMKKHNYEVKSRYERREYLKELDEFEETIHGKHEKLID